MAPRPLVWKGLHAGFISGDLHHGKRFQEKTESPEQKITLNLGVV
jgi:hypothetical protein